MTRRPMPSIPCDCDLCAALSAALDAHRAAITRGDDVEETRRAVHDAAVRVDVVHGLDRPIRRREMMR